MPQTINNNCICKKSRHLMVPCIPVTDCYLFYANIYLNAFYQPNQTPWHAYLIEDWLHTEFYGQPQIINFIFHSPGIGWPANARAAINWACCSWGWRTKGGGWLAAFGYPFPAAWAACWAACAAWAGLLVAAAAAAVIEKKKMGYKTRMKRPSV